MDISQRWAHWRYVSADIELCSVADRYEQTGAVIVYTPEVGISLDMLRDDVQFLKNRYNLDVKGKSEGRLVIRLVVAIIHPH